MKPDADIAVILRSPKWKEHVPGAVALARRAAAAALEAARTRARPKAGPDLGAAAVELSVVLADDAFVQCLNRDFRGQDRPTNVLSFPAAPGEGAAPRPAGAALPLGDVVIAYETAAGEAAAQDKRIEDHLRHLVVHGVLHLLGYDHRDEDEARGMEALETAVLAGLGVADPYAPRAGAKVA